jgi:hypothetical protein
MGKDKLYLNILINAGMKYRNKKKFHFGIPAYTGPFRALCGSMLIYHQGMILFMAAVQRQSHHTDINKNSNNIHVKKL